jgi:hypothetical protein
MGIWETLGIPLHTALHTAPIPVFTLQPIAYRVYDTALNAGMILFNTALGKMGTKKESR